jgi:hypothetical protein
VSKLSDFGKSPKMAHEKPKAAPKAMIVKNEKKRLITRTLTRL